jgi:hypothetical protein
MAHITSQNITHKSIDIIISLLSTSYDMTPFEITKYDVQKFIIATNWNINPDLITEQNIHDSIRRLFLIA